MLNNDKKFYGQAPYAGGYAGVQTTREGERDMTCSLTVDLTDRAAAGAQTLLCPEVRATSERIADICVACGEHLAHHNCDSCDRRVCKACVVLGAALPFSSFCSSECRDEAELAAEEARQTDVTAR